MINKRLVKLSDWPFNEGELAQLIWISSPFSKDKKIMVYAYFSAHGRTEKILIDWGTLPALAIQHYYINGDISKSIEPVETEEVDITIFPNTVTYSEREWSIYGTNEKDISRSFIASFNNKKYILPLIEVVRSILAPNRFLLYRLFETNSFPQYSTEYYETNKIHLDFSSQYHRKYTKNNFLHQLVWLLTNPDLRQVFENVAYTFINTGILKFNWIFNQTIKIKAIVKKSSIGGTILRIKSVKNKRIPYNEISITHPEIVQHERSGEAKKYTFNVIQNKGTDKPIELDEDVEGTTDNFDLIEMDNQIHEYVKLPKVTKLKSNSKKQRMKEDENTKKYFIDDDGRRATSDVGGSKVARGIEKKSVYEIEAKGELRDFLNVLKVLEEYQEIKAISVSSGVLPIGNEKRKFSYLEDGVTRRKYILAIIELLNGRHYRVLEIERETHSLSMLILLSTKVSLEWKSVIQDALVKLVEKNGVWAKEIITYIEAKGLIIKRVKHSRKNLRHRAENLIKKILIN